MQYRFCVSAEYDQKKLLHFLRGGCALSASLVRSVKYLDDGLLVDGRRAKTNQMLQAGQTVIVNLPAGDSGLPPCDIAVPVVYEDADATVLDKPAGMATHPTLNHPGGTLANVYAGDARRRGLDAVFRPVNRLDKNTSGLVLAAKTRYAAPLLADSVQKEYIAVCGGCVEPDSGLIEAPIARAEGTIIGRTVRADGAPSTTCFEVLARRQECTVLRVVTLTGRTHQIRVHLAHIGHPLLGDTLYGGDDARIARQALHCARMSFARISDGQTVTVDSQLPADMAALCDDVDLEKMTKTDD